MLKFNGKAKFLRQKVYFQRVKGNESAAFPIKQSADSIVVISDKEWQQ